MLPIGTLYDPFVGPALEPWSFGQDLEWTLLYALSRLGRTYGISSYFRLSTRPIDQTLPPHFQVQTDVAMDGAIAFRQQLKDAGAIAPSFNDLIVKAAAFALREHPLVHGSYRDGRLELYSNVNIGIAVAADRALVVPTISGADQKSLGTIAAESTRLAERVRTGQISPTELSGATFTVSNLGMYGVTAIIPVINPPQAAILGVGAIRDTLARVGGEIVDRHLMTLTLSCDHRILDGARAAEFLSTIRTLLEQPLRLAL